MANGRRAGGSWWWLFMLNWEDLSANPRQFQFPCCSTCSQRYINNDEYWVRISTHEQRGLDATKARWWNKFLWCMMAWYVKRRGNEGFLRQREKRRVVQWQMIWGDWRRCFRLRSFYVSIVSPLLRKWVFLKSVIFVRCLWRKGTRKKLLGYPDQRLWG